MKSKKNIGLGIALVFFANACMMDDDKKSSTIEDEFLARARGQWTYTFKVGDAEGAVWVVDLITLDKERHDISADIYADEGRTTRLFHYDAKGKLAVVERSQQVPDAYKINVDIDYATMTAFVDDPQLFAALGLDDCNLVVNQAVDIMATNCVAPLARDTQCVEKDLYQVPASGDSLRVGEAMTDRCTDYPTGIDTTRAPDQRK